MGYTWANSSWQRMEAIGRQEMAYSKLARARSNCFKDGDYDSCENSPYDVHKRYHGSQDYGDQNCGREVNHEGLLGENDYQNMENAGKMDYYSYDIISFPSLPPYSYFGHFCKETKSCSFELDLDGNFLQYACTLTSMSRRRYIMDFEGQGESVGGKLLLCHGDSSMNFSSNLFLFYIVFSFKELKLFLDRYSFLEFNLARSTSYSRYFSHSCYEPWNICDSLGMLTIAPSVFLEKISYCFDGSLFSLLGDHCVKIQGEVVKHSQYVLTFLDPYVIGFDELNLVEKPLLLIRVVKGINLSL
ncbi:hypothetical protein M9H77_07988 [Catharanthus roseus]|uniref:Uncharacterized protein n=1 Tax=Catharanthus roseus TaxID=4058 RepID=A0ACC0BWX7_CATRO|nr:hypothetical protein M9H77_07988 [Catharanthus roseus]